MVHAESKSFALFFQNETQYNALLEAFAAITHIPSKPEAKLYKPRPAPSKAINTETIVISMNGESAKKEEAKCICLEKCEKVAEKCDKVLIPVCPNIEPKVVKPVENMLVEKPLNVIEKLSNKLEVMNLNEKQVVHSSTKSGKKVYSINVDQATRMYEPKITNLVSQTCKAVGKQPCERLSSGQVYKKQGSTVIAHTNSITNLGEDLFISPDRQQKVVMKMANKENMSSDWDEDSNGKAKNKFDANDNWDD